MKIESKEQYDLLQEQAHEIENKIKGYKFIFEELENILRDIDYIASYDVYAAEYLIEQLPKYINVSYNKIKPSTKREETALITKSFQNRSEVLSDISMYDPERAKEIRDQILEPIRRVLKNEE